MQKYILIIIILALACSNPVSEKIEEEITLIGSWYEVEGGNVITFSDNNEFEASIPNGTAVSGTYWFGKLPENPEKGWLYTKAKDSEVIIIIPFELKEEVLIICFGGNYIIEYRK